MKESDSGQEEARRPQKKKTQKSNKKVNVRWAITILGWSFVLTMVFTVVSDYALNGVGYVVAFLVLGAFILLGILFDILGVAATAAAEAPFHAMASRRVPGAKEAIWLTRNAEKVGSFCNDVVGDISGIISGSTAAVIIARLRTDFPGGAIAFPLIVTGLVAGLTVGGKALGKGIAIGNSNKIVFTAGRFLHLFKR